MIEAVGKGESGADVLQRVVGPSGQACGAILWESKRTKNWSDGRLAKLRTDQRAAKSELAILVSFARPKDIDTFGHLAAFGWSNRVSPSRWSSPFAKP